MTETTLSAIPEHPMAATILFAALRQAEPLVLAQEVRALPVGEVWELVPSPRFFLSTAYLDLQLRMQITRELRHYSSGVSGNRQLISEVQEDVFYLHVWWFSSSRDQFANATLPRGHQTPNVMLSGDPMRYFYIIPAVVDQLVSLDERAVVLERLASSDLDLG